MVDELEPQPSVVSQGNDDRSAGREAQFRLARQLIAEQNPGGAIMGGFGAALVGALAWGAIALVTGGSYSIVAIGLGAMVGYAVKIFGKGVTDLYSYIAAGFAVFGCLAGKAITLALIGGRGYERLLSRFFSSLGFMDLVFWFVAIFGAWWFAKRDLSKEQGLAMYQYELRRPDDNS